MQCVLAIRYYYVHVCLTPVCRDECDNTTLNLSPLLPHGTADAHQARRAMLGGLLGAIKCKPSEEPDGDAPKDPSQLEPAFYQLPEQLSAVTDCGNGYTDYYYTYNCYTYYANTPRMAADVTAVGVTAAEDAEAFCVVVTDCGSGYTNYCYTYNCYTYYAYALGMAAKLQEQKRRMAGGVTATGVTAIEVAGSNGTAEQPVRRPNPFGGGGMAEMLQNAKLKKAGVYTILHALNLVLLTVSESVVTTVPDRAPPSTGSVKPKPPAKSMHIAWRKDCNVLDVSSVKRKRRTAHWDKLVPADIDNTVFSQMKPGDVKLDTSLLEAAFLEQAPVTTASSTAAATAERLGAYVGDAVHICTMQTAHCVQYLLPSLLLAEHTDTAVLYACGVNN
eukprot:1284-Heterococcus_DN1.PRE.4